MSNIATGQVPFIYASKEMAIYPKTEFVDGINEMLLKHERENGRWMAIGLKAPTRGTVMNWCTGATKPTNPLYLEALSEYLNIPIDKLF